jgi:glycosyltransferase involved in cell wall biosynthesis
MGHKQGLETVIDAAMALSSDPGVRVVLAGDGNARHSLARKADALGSSNLQFVGPQPWGAHEAMLEAADVLVVNQRASVVDMSLPSKLTSYFAAGRPTIATVSVTSETAREIERSGGGVLVPPDSPDALARAVRELRASPERCFEFGRNAKRYANERLSAAANLPQYEAFLSAACRRPDTRAPKTR